ncbi:MAG: DUF2188 domain-containing protein [Ignavibacteria bacterium]|nr:DUF2188 domain-containing protein [Ignavibacteria bacterium]
MTKKNQWVVHNDNGWAVRGEGNDKLTVKTDTKKEAIDIARQIAKNQKSELIITGMDGKIQSKDSHGNDTYPPKG